MKKNALIVLSILILAVCNFSFGIAGSWVGLYAFQDQSKEISNTSKPAQKAELANANPDIFVDVVSQVQDSVVNVIITKDLPIYEEQYSQDPYEDFWGFGIPQRERVQVGEEERQVGAGSGFVVSQDGYIVTNRHVVSDREADYTVVMNSGEKYPAKIIDLDNFLDIAILKIDAPDLKPLEFADSDNARVGQQVLAIGNTLGEFSNTVSSGIISGLYREIVAGSRGGRDAESLSGLIQTDAAISPGNSGGPLVDLNGNVIGVNVAVSASGENIGFAIPSNQVKTLVESVKKHGRIVRPMLGIRYVQVTAELKEQNNLKYDYGVIVLRGENPKDLAVVPGSAADKAGIVENDVILEVNGKKITEEISLATEIQKHKPGDKIKLKIFSKDSEKIVDVELGENR